MLSVSQYQQLYSIALTEKDPVNAVFKYVGVVVNKTDDEIDQMSMEEFKEIGHKVITLLLLTTEAHTPIRYVKIKDQAFEFLFDQQKLQLWQIIKINELSKGNIIENLHLLGAAMVRPVRKYKLFTIRKKANVWDHERIAELIKSAPFETIHAACSYWLTMWKESLERLRPALKAELTGTGKVDDATADQHIDTVKEVFELNFN